MFLELIGVIFAGFGTAGAVMLLNHALRGRIPRWFTPVAAGGAMIVATISNEYSWFNRTQATLPDGVEVAASFQKQGLMRPWTYFAPYTDKFAALDIVSKRKNDAQPDMHMMDLLLFARWSAVQKIPMIFDCAGGRQATLIETATFGANGALQNAEWYTPPSDDPVQLKACQEV